MTITNSPGRSVANVIFIVVGILSAGMGLKGFLLSSRFIDGGVTGVSMLLSDLLGLPLSVLIIVINLPFIVLGYRLIGWRFALKSTLAIAGLGVCLAFVPYPDVTPDLLLTAVFGGFFIGAGIGLSMRGGAVLDGTEVAAVIISRTSTLLKVSDIILIMNVFIFGAAAFFISVDSALYSMITYFAASKTIDFLIHGIEGYTAVLIVSEQHEAIRQRLIETGYGVTILKGQNGYGKSGRGGEPVDILYVVITRLEATRLRNMIADVDDGAFVLQYAVDDVMGGRVKSLPLH